MRSVRLPQVVMVAVALGQFVAALYGIRQYGALGEAGYGLLALAAGAVGAAFVAGLIYANYESYPRPRSEREHINGTCQ